jgi:hypothetical protein
VGAVEHSYTQPEFAHRYLESFGAELPKRFFGPRR